MDQQYPNSVHQGSVVPDSYGISPVERVPPRRPVGGDNGVASSPPPVYLSPDPTKKQAFSFGENDLGSGSNSQAQTPNTIEQGNYGFTKAGAGDSSGVPPSKPKGNVLIRIIKNWPLELLSCLLMVALVVTEIVLLARYNKHAISVWPHNWKINSVFAFLTTLLEASMTFCVLTCIGQLRWLWFEKKPDALMWMDRLTRMHSAPGAVMFLATKGSFKRFATLGALIIVALLGISTFVQNVIVQRAESFDVSNDPAFNISAVDILTEYTWFLQGTTGSVAGDQQPIAPMIGAIESGFFVPASFQSIDSATNNAFCDTGNCTFGAYQSMAVCHECVDVSSQVLGGPDFGLYWLPDGYDVSLDSSNGYLNMSSRAEYPTSANLPQSGPLIATFQAIAAADPQTAGNGAVATECAIYWCVQTYNGAMHDHKMEETVVDEWTDLSIVTDYNNPEDVYLSPPQCIMNSTEQAPDYPGCNFTAGGYTQSGLQNHLLGYFDNKTQISIEAFLWGHVYEANSDIKNQSWVISTSAASAVYSAATWPQLGRDGFLSVLTDSIGNMTLYMTNSIRRTAGFNTSLPQYSSGLMTQTSQHFHVRWGWMAYPLGLVLCTLIFLLVTLIKCEKSHTHLWKTSVIAMMFHPFSEPEIDEFLSLGTLDRMKDAMHRHKVHLVNHRFRPHGRSDHPEGLDEDGVHRVAHVSRAAFDPLNDMVN